jgi:hypothetical protein
MRSTAVVQTDHAARYMGQLVKHFAHKRPTTLEPGHGSITFDSGVCEVSAGEALTLTCIASEEDMARLQDVVVRHLVRFAFREADIPVNWGPLEP